jgi:lysophospholipase L1-like esterase
VQSSRDHWIRLIKWPYQKQNCVKIAPNSTLIMAGDSITDAGRDVSGNPTPWSPNIGLGLGYVALVDAHFGAFHPEYLIRVINAGVSGNTVLDVAARWRRDVLKRKPDWISLMIGINDVWRQFDQPRVVESHVTPKVYEQTLDLLVVQAKNRVRGVVLMTPFMVESNRHDAMRCRMDEYGTIVKRIARKHRTLYVDTQLLFDSVVKYTHPMSLAWDRIHVNFVGHLLLARAFLDAVEAKH